ncbi:MAG: YlxR family protein, partial [Actinomycetota bacterium]
RGKASKRDLIRVARVREGDAAVDPSGSAPGRGAYVHRDAGCIEAAVRTKAFERALGAGLSTDAAARLGSTSERSIGAV